MTVLNELDRFHVVMGALDRLPKLGDAGERLRNLLAEKLRLHGVYIREHGEDMPEVRNWAWRPRTPAVTH
jgi:xylulose-5-phosphate/fructose-6-phosphate phosphoketolase